MELSTGQEMAVFRIVQECLTNALKHGGRGTDVRLHFDWSGPGLTLHVASAVAAIGPEDAADPAGPGWAGDFPACANAPIWPAAG